MIKNVTNKEKQEILGVISTGRREIHQFNLPLQIPTTRRFAMTLHRQLQQYVPFQCYKRRQSTIQIMLR